MVNNIWVVRHGERIDNIDSTWHYQAPRNAWDDPYLTLRGHQQAREVGLKFVKENTQIDHIFCSPFIRCVQTASNIINELHTANKSLKLQIKIEPGFAESLFACQRPPGYLPINSLKEEFNVIDDKYVPVYRTEELPIETTSICAFSRVQKTLKVILRNCSGNILVVSHGSPIAGCHAALVKKFTYVGQCTITKYRKSDSMPMDIKPTMDDFINEYVGDSSHLSDRNNLRDQIKISEEERRKLKQYIYNYREAASSI